MLDDLKHLFKGNNFIGQMIVINASLFLLVNILSHIFFNGSEGVLFSWLGLPAMVNDMVKVPWTLLTYMFMHGGLWHLVFNMYMLYWFGRIFNDFLGEKRLIGLYFLGGLAGGALFVLTYSVLFLSGEAASSAVLVGSSAAVMAITIAVGARFPDYVVHLMFLGAVRMKYVALVIFILSTVIDFSNNMGGKIAHLGGAAVGFFYATGLNKGKDFAMAFYGWFDRIKDWFKRKPKLRVVPGDQTAKKGHKRGKDDLASGKEIQARTNAILDKISKSGYENLTREEKDFLFKISNKP